MMGALDNLQTTLEQRHGMLVLQLGQAQVEHARAHNQMEALEEGLAKNQALLDQAVTQDKELGKLLAAMGRAGEAAEVGVQGGCRGVGLQAEVGVWGGCRGTRVEGCRQGWAGRVGAHVLGGWHRCVGTGWTLARGSCWQLQLRAWGQHQSALPAGVKACVGGTWCALV